ncbi:hypothetical protein [Bacillus sp. EB600]|uniref:hypothetical protein n=1 Tax=Bacillus sp. EB600 TaxID=2806345 RepID=UPI00210E8E5E|nr:hypothetical protein [Bacillus sp. EB600]MCQ6281370.1 hypothetical protein [Bacillus sp. EB600]
MPNMKNILGLKTAAQPEGGEGRPSDAGSISSGVEHTGATAHSGTKPNVPHDPVTDRTPQEQAPPQEH